jgi:hypothetical protein
MALLDLRGFSCGYGEMIAVRDLSFAIDAVRQRCGGIRSGCLRSKTTVDLGVGQL